MWATNGKLLGILETKPSVQTGGFFVGDDFTGRLLSGIKMNAACKVIWGLKTGIDQCLLMKNSRSLSKILVGILKKYKKSHTDVERICVARFWTWKVCEW